MQYIEATFEDHKRIKTRASVQLIFEIPEEQYLPALNYLGALKSGESTHVVIKKLEIDNTTNQGETNENDYR